MEGYIKLSRLLLSSDIWFKPPIYLKVWIYLLHHAAFKPYNGLARGQLVTSIPKIQEALSYRAGFITKQRLIRKYGKFWTTCEGNSR